VRLGGSLHFRQGASGDRHPKELLKTTTDGCVTRSSPGVTLLQNGTYPWAHSSHSVEKQRQHGADAGWPVAASALSILLDNGS